MDAIRAVLRSRSFPPEARISDFVLLIRETEEPPNPGETSTSSIKSSCFTPAGPRRLEEEADRTYDERVAQGTRRDPAVREAAGGSRPLESSTLEETDESSKSFSWRLANYRVLQPVSSKTTTSLEACRRFRRLGAGRPTRLTCRIDAASCPTSKMKSPFSAL